jgi:NAD-dependent SIR2 family protein deacetylase
MLHPFLSIIASLREKRKFRMTTDSKRLRFNEGKLTRAAQWIREADGLLITAGAGMGVDSGLPDFRGQEGLWRAYPALKQANLRFEQIASPEAMRYLPSLWWGFYGHRLKLYRETQPHEGFRILQRWASGMEHGSFVFTSNVDGHFQKAGFSEARIVECHGSIHHLQCAENCGGLVWRADDFVPEVDEVACQLVSAAPRCPHCGGMARPNILMFNDGGWDESRTENQLWRLQEWHLKLSKLVVVELGAGQAIPTVRRFSERFPPRVIRINPRDFSIAPYIGVGIAGGALEILQEIDAILNA